MIEHVGQAAVAHGKQGLFESLGRGGLDRFLLHELDQPVLGEAFEEGPCRHLVLLVGQGLLVTRGIEDAAHVARQIAVVEGRGRLHLLDDLLRGLAGNQQAAADDRLAVQIGVSQ